MSRKLLALLVACTFSIGLVASPASAGPSFASSGVKANGTFKALSKTTLPFANTLARTSVPEKPAHAITTAEARPAAKPARMEKVGATLAAKLAAGTTADQKYRVIVSTSVDPGQMSLAGVTMERTYRRAITGFAAQLTAAQIQQLRQNRAVQSIGLDEVVHATIDNASKYTGVTQARRDFRVTGDGDGWQSRYSTRDAVIAVVDTGIDAGHKDLAGKVIGWMDLVNGETEPYDDYGHGTHVSGIAAGAGVANPLMKGVAPGAALVGVKVLDEYGSGYFSDVIAGIEWVIDNKDTYNIRVLSMSLGTSYPSDGQDELSLAVNSAADSGIVAVVAGGNGGPDWYSTASPAAADRAIAVCAMRDQGQAGWSLNWWSSRGPTVDGRLKPDICAPGYEIAAPVAGTTSRYTRWSGTSMATPFVAGVAALLLSVNPYLTVDQVKEAIFSTAEDWGEPGPDLDFGYGRIDGYKALAKVMAMGGKPPVFAQHGTISGTVEEAGESWYYVDVTDTRVPLAATLLLTYEGGEEYYDLDMVLYDEDGNLLDGSWSWDRQETINYRAVAPGRYYVLINAYEGSGEFTLDGSWK